ncbi:hypothetical protein HYU15_03965 [Candidatus Woesearchaeota archaeon]|nr:hypothetical protein [Candidatus Woesearchaeota archaeon]
MKQLVHRIRSIKWMKVLDVLGWIGFFYLIVYGFLKVFGVIHSPLIVDATAIASIAFFAGKSMMKIETMEKTLEQHSTELRTINSRLSRHDFDIEKLNIFLSANTKFR